MTTTTIRWQGTRAELLNRLRSIPSVITGRLPDDAGVVQGLKLRIGMVLLGKIYDAYLVKSEGGTDEMGITWPPLSPVTLALRRVVFSPKQVRKLKLSLEFLPDAVRFRIHRMEHEILQVYKGRGQGNEHRKHALKILERQYKQGILTERRYNETKKALTFGLNKEKAESRAFAGAFAQILRDTGRLFNSFSPAVAGSGGSAGDQAFQTGPGFVAVGTNVDYFKYHQSKNPRKLKKDGTPKLPRRQILPDDTHPMPKSWWHDVVAALGDGLGGKTFWRTFLGPKAA